MRAFVYALSLAFFAVAVFFGIPLLLVLLVAVLAVGWVAAFGMVAGTTSLLAGMLLHEPAAFRGALFLLSIGAVAFVILTLAGGAWHGARGRVRGPSQAGRRLRVTLRSREDANFFEHGTR